MLQIKSFVFSPIAENTYVLYNEQQDCLIADPGCYHPEEREQLRQFITAHGLRPKLLLNTHCHLDHVFGNKFVAETWGLRPQMHRKEEQMLHAAPASGLMWGMPFEGYQGELIFLKAGDRIVLGDDELEVLEAPGHSPGHLCFYCAAQGFLIGGDVLFRGSIGRTDLPGGDYATLINSIRTRLLVLPEETVVYSGHGEPTSIGVEKRSNPFLQQA